jgi:hypothetical protein
MQHALMIWNSVSYASNTGKALKIHLSVIKACGKRVMT